MKLTPYALYLISKRPKTPEERLSDWNSRWQSRHDRETARRAYRRDWMRRKRAAAQSSAPPSPSTSFLDTASSRLTHSTT